VGTPISWPLFLHYFTLPPHGLHLPYLDHLILLGRTKSHSFPKSFIKKKHRVPFVSSIKLPFKFFPALLLYK